MLEYPPKFSPVGIRLAFYGPMASGKTTVATNLFPDRKYVKESLAKPLKDTAREYYGVTGKTNDERKILQELADDLKKWDNDVFTKLLLWRLHYYYLADGDLALPIVVDDLRFKHEADDLRDYGFEIVRVSVAEDIRLARIAEKYPDTDPARFIHRSETDLENIVEDIRVTGNGQGGINFLKKIYAQSV